jgi:hypothetical protein
MIHAVTLRLSLFVQHRAQSTANVRLAIGEKREVRIGFRRSVIIVDQSEHAPNLIVRLLGSCELSTGLL